MKNHELDRLEVRNELFSKLAELAKNEPIPAIMSGDRAVGMTLLHALGMEYSSAMKPAYKGIVINAARGTRKGIKNRVNLFAQVPNWELSVCKSSKEILQRYGIDLGESRQRLYCTVSSKAPNSHGLLLQVDRNKNQLDEIYKLSSQYYPVVSWKLEKLEKRLLENHPETLWVKATVFEKQEQEYYQFREVVYTGPPNCAIFPDLLASGTITVDHLIESKHNRIIEKGPLFKIKHENLSLLFPAQQKFDLLNF